MARLRGFITSYVGLVVGSLVVILVSMNALAVGQTDWQLSRHQTHGLISFAPEGLADYKPRTEARSIVIGFESGVVGGLREAITSLSSVIPVVSQRVVDEVRRDDIARASLAAGSSFGLSADAARAVAAQAVASTGLVPSLPGLTSPPAAGAQAPSQPAASPSPSPAATLQSGAAPATTTATTAASTQPAESSPTTTRTATPSPTVSGAGGSSGGGEAATTQPGATTVPATSPPAQSTQVPPAATQVASPVPAVTQTVPAATAAATSTALPLATSTARSAPTLVPPATSTPVPLPTDVPELPTAVPSATPTATPIPGATPVPSVTPTPVPEFLMDLSVQGGSSVSFQPIFSGAVEFKAGVTQTRTVNIQNNGSREFRYYLNTSGGSGLLWTDTTNGLQLSVSRNGVVVYSGPLSMADQQLGQLARGGQDTLVIGVTLPSTADNRYQGLTTTMSYNFTAVAVP